MSVIRTGQENYFSIPVKSENFLREKSTQRSAIDEEAFVVRFSGYGLRFAFCNTPRLKMMSQYVLKTEVCAILGDRKRMIHL